MKLTLLLKLKRIYTFEDKPLIKYLLNGNGFLRISYLAYE